MGSGQSSMYVCMKRLVYGQIGGRFGLTGSIIHRLMIGLQNASEIRNG